MSKKDLKPQLDLNEIWPQERDFVSRPERFKYVRKLVEPKGCVFCEAKNKGVGQESLCLYLGEHAMVILNKYPYNTGHTLVLPVRHCGNLSELSGEEYSELSEILRSAFEIVENAYQCEGVNLGMNHGQAAGAGLPDHLHWHIIPRWVGDTNFFPLICETKVHPESLEQSYERLSKEFKKL